MASKLSIRRAQAHVTCALCDSEQNVNWFCNDCQETLCDRCKDAHKRGKKTRTDDVVPYKEARHEEERPVPEVCKTHPDKVCDLYCSTCQVLMCNMCCTQKHKQHEFNHLEDEFLTQKENVQDQIISLKSKLGEFQERLSKRHESNTSYIESIDTMRKDVESQRTKLKADVDSTADALVAKASGLKEMEVDMHRKDGQNIETNMEEIRQLIERAEVEASKAASVSLLDLARTLRTTLPLYNVNTGSVLPLQPRYVPGTVVAPQLSTMMGHIQTGYEKKEINSKHVHQVYVFTVPGQTTSICPIDDQHAWVATFDSSKLILVNKDGKVTESVQLDFKPWCLALTNTSGLLVTSNPVSPEIYNVSADRRVTTFADVTPHKVRGIHISEDNEVVVGTGTPTILVLNSSGNTIRELTCGSNGYSIVCLSSGHVAVTTGPGVYKCTEVVIKDMSDKVVQTWTGELDNGQKVDNMAICTIGCDEHDRMFVPDRYTHQVYVISPDVRHATCLLDDNHGVQHPLCVCVDTCGDVWIGCVDGTVYVMRL